MWGRRMAHRGVGARGTRGLEQRETRGGGEGSEPGDMGGRSMGRLGLERGTRGRGRLFRRVPPSWNPLLRPHCVGPSCLPTLQRPPCPPTSDLPTPCGRRSTGTRGGGGRSGGTREGGIGAGGHRALEHGAGTLWICVTLPSFRPLPSTTTSSHVPSTAFHCRPLPRHCISF